MPVPVVPPTMDQAAPRIQDQAVLAMPAPVATSMTALAARNIPDQAVSSTTVPVVPPTMDLAAPRIQDQAVLAMPVLVAPATQVQVERVNIVHRYADSLAAMAILVGWEANNGPLPRLVSLDMRLETSSIF
jgi:hypothetical protein